MTYCNFGLFCCLIVNLLQQWNQPFFRNLWAQSYSSMSIVRNLKALPPRANMNKNSPTYLLHYLTHLSRPQQKIFNSSSLLRLHQCNPSNYMDRKIEVDKGAMIPKIHEVKMKDKREIKVAKRKLMYEIFLFQTCDLCANEFQKDVSWNI